MNPFEKVLNFIDSKLLNLPKWLFWFLLIGITWFYLLRRVISWDLWWHMAAGRFLCENGLSYPSNDTFTYSPVSATEKLAYVWIGDIILYQVYNWFGFIGLQILRVAMVLSAVWAVLKVSKYRYNVWTLLGSIFLIIGTMQKHLIKNAIFAMFFFGLITWGWVQVKHNNKRYFIWLFGLMLILWNNMHGTASLGWAFLLLIFAGECVDQLISFLRHKKVDWALVGAFFLVLAISYPYINGRWHMNLFKTIESVVSNLHEEKTAVSSTDTTLSQNQKKESLSLNTKIDLLNDKIKVLNREKRSLWNDFYHLKSQIKGTSLTPQQEGQLKALQSQISAVISKINNLKNNQQGLVKAELKPMLRFLFKGHDAQIVAEYQWPFEISYVLSIKLLFFLVLIYSIYFILKLAFDVKNFKFSMEVPCILMIVISLGYLRTVSYSFLAIIPFLAYGMSHGFTYLDQKRRRNASFILCGIVVFIFLVWFLVPSVDVFFQIWHKVMENTAGITMGPESPFMDNISTAWGNEGLKIFLNPVELINQKSVMLVLGSIQYLAWPFYFVLPIIAIIFLIKIDFYFKLFLKILRTILGIWILVCLFSYFIYENKLYRADQFHVVTGFLDTEQGFGKSNKFFKGMADYVIDNYPGEKIYNTYNMGGYLQWEWYGKKQVFIDGRSAVYDGAFYQDYIKNNAASYINKYPLKTAILNFLVDRDRVTYFLKSGWYPVAFDACMVVMERPTRHGSSFGVVPKFFKGERPIQGGVRLQGKSLEYLDRKAFGIFLSQATHHMLIEGRVKDLKDLLDYLDDPERNVIAQLPLAFKTLFSERKKFVGEIVKRFGPTNHPVLGALNKKIFDKVKGVEYHKAMAEAFHVLNKLPEAEMEYMTAYKMKKGDLQILTKLGDVSFKLKKYKNSVHLYHEAIKLNPQEPSYYNNISLPLLKLGKVQDALAMCNQSIALNPKYFHGYYNKGMIFIESRNLPEAKKQFTQLLKINPNFQPAKDRLKEIEAIIRAQP